MQRAVRARRRHRRLAQPGGELLVVDLIAREVIHAIPLAAAPMGVAVSPDGLVALTANFGDDTTAGDTLSVVDLEAGVVVATHTVGGHPEQVALSPDGTVGAIPTDDDSALRTFTLSGHDLVLSDPIEVPADPGDVAFVGRDRVVVASSIAGSFSLIDTSDPLAPVALAEYPTPSGIPFGATTIPGTTEVLLPTFLAAGTVLRVDVAAEPAVTRGEIALESGSLILGVAVSADGRFAYVPQPADRRLSIVDLSAGSVRSLGWLTDVGPTWVAAQP